MKDDIIRMAREAGLTEFGGYTEQNIKRFAALVAAAEREACAQIAFVAFLRQMHDAYALASDPPRGDA